MRQIEPGDVGEAKRQKAMAAGELTPDEAGAIAGVIEAKRRAIETVELEERLRKLEEGMPK
jgi:hypothetical protein